MKRIFSAFILSASLLSASAQERIGIANSNYSSINSIFLNPSSSVDCRTLAQFNLVGLNLYAMNNQVYIPQLNVKDAMNGIVQDSEIREKGFKRFAYVKAEVNGPSLIVSNQEIGAGLFTRARMELSVNNIPAELTQMLVKEKIDTAQQFSLDIKNTRVMQMSWVEWGANFGWMYFKHNKTLITVGGNAKYITGVNVAYGNIYRLNADVNGSQFTVQDARARVRYNEPGWNTGKGFGLDLGITYKKTLNFVEGYYANSQKSGCKYIDYKYKLGASFLDIGAIKFNPNTYKGDVSGSTVINDFKNSDIDSILRADFTLSQRTDVPVWASLPAAFSLQGDLNLTHHFYVNATLVQGITTSRMVGVQHANSISITPRFETRNIEIAVPFTMYRYIYPQLGAAIRFRTFVIGMDNIMPFLTRSNVYGGNIYFNLGLSIFKNPKCKKSKPRYTPTKKTYEGYTFLSLKNKKRSVIANGQGEAPEGFAGGNGKRTKGAKVKKEKRRGIIRRKSKKL
ncbi:MAG: DUF5723 family protein [Bacteroidia bacterium]